MFGVICSEIAPIWLRKYISEEKLEELKDIHFVPIDKGEISEEELFTNLAKLAGISPEKVREEFDELTILNEETIKIINGLKRNYKIGLCSNSPSKFIRNILRINNLEKLFEVIVVSSEHGIAKPDHKIYQITLDQLESKAGETIFIDDNVKNVKAAEDMGIKALLFTGADSLRSDLQKLTSFPDTLD